MRRSVAGFLDALEPRALGKAQRTLFRLVGWSIPNDLATYRTYAHHLTTYANLVRGVAEPAPSMENVCGFLTRSLAFVDRRSSTIDPS